VYHPPKKVKKNVVYNTRPLITTSESVQARCHSTLLLKSAQATEIQHHIYKNNSIPFCPPPQGKYTLPELRCSLFPSLATNRVPRLLQESVLLTPQSHLHARKQGSRRNCLLLNRKPLISLTVPKIKESKPINRN